jgi:hypothetical protein
MGTALGLATWMVRATARLLVVALSVTTLGPLLHGAHDPDLSPVIIAHDESLHHVQRAPAPGDGFDVDHCIACHFVRSSRGAVSWEPCGLIAFASGQLLYHSDGILTAAPCATPQPARAPPLV